METLMNANIPSGGDVLLLWEKAAIAILIGLLVGVERERNKRISEKFFGGIRTFPLITILGFIAALTSSFTSIAVFIAVFVMFGVLVSISYYFSAMKGDFGGTTEISFIIVYVLGALVYWNYILFASAISVVVVTFLSLKSHFRAFAGKIEEEDIFATIKLAIITIIILPLLPNETFGPFDAFNPQKIWLLVILIASISFIGYVIFKLIDPSKGIQILSILGGIASSTAVALSFTERSKEYPELSRSFAAGIILASTVMYPRVLLIIFVLNEKLAGELLIPFLVFSVTGVIVSFFLWKGAGKNEGEHIKLTNPFKLMVALKFGLVFAVILFIANAAEFYFGHGGIIATSFFSGLADVDAIILSLSDMVSKSLELKLAAVSVIIATVANSIVKGLIASLMGAKELRKYSLAGFSVIVVISLVFIIGYSV